MNVPKNNEYDKLSLPYDPDLKEAMIKIQAIMDDYKIGGNVCLSSRTHSEFLYNFPEWCVVQLDKVTPEGQRISIDVKPKEIDEASRNAHNDTLSSVHMIARGRDMAASAFSVFDDIFNRLKKHMVIEHDSLSGFAPHDLH
jgi:hypothetical protein